MSPLRSGVRAIVGRLMLDASLSDGARVLGFFIAGFADWQEIAFDDPDAEHAFARVLHRKPGKDKIRGHLRELLVGRYIERRPGGGGHSDEYRIRVGVEPHATGSMGVEPEPISPCDPDRMGAEPHPSDGLGGGYMGGEDPSPTNQSVNHSPGAGGEGHDLERARRDRADRDAAALVVVTGWCGGPCDELQRFLTDTAPPLGWAADVVGWYRPRGDGGQEGTEWGTLAGVGDRPKLWRQVLGDFASEGCPWDRSHFRGFVRRAAGAAAAAERKATGTDGRAPGRPWRGKERRPIDAPTRDIVPTDDFEGFNT